MAFTRSSDTRRQLKSTIECSLCKLIYSDPRILPCVHTYCLRCLRDVVRQRNTGDEAACPLCRKEFVIPDGGFEGLPKNFFAEHSKDMAQGSSTHCEGCSSDESIEQVPATMFCVACNQRFCKTCVQIHGRIRATRTHELVEMSDDENIKELSAKFVRSYCDEHQDEALKYYCFDCKSPICVTCFVKLHKSHECQDIDEVADDFRPQINENIDNLVVAVRKCREVIADRIKDKEELRREMSRVEKEICDQAEQKKKRSNETNRNY